MRSLILLAALAISSARGYAQYTVPLSPAIVTGHCVGVITNLATVLLYPFQPITSNCTQVSSFSGYPIRAGIAKNLRVNVVVPSNTVGGGIVTVYKNNSAQALTCTLSNGTSCQDTAHTFSTSANDQIGVNVTSGGGTVTTGPSYSSGGTGCTAGTRAVTFSNHTSGANATGTITVSGSTPTGAVTIVTGGSGYASGTPPTTGTVATCTGTTTFTGGAVTVDVLSGIVVSLEIQ